MGKKMKLIPSLFSKNKETWQWPSCKHPKTLSFRATGHDDMFKTVNSIFFDPDVADTPSQGSLFTNSSESVSISTESEEFGELSVETIIRGARSERLFFDTTSSSILEKVEEGEIDNLLPFKESLVLAMESEDPYVDFKRSMEEMVESHGLKDWDCLEELLGWYLNMNGKNNHGFIVGAFVDLLVGLANATTCSDSTTSYSSAASTFSSPFNSPQKEIDEEDDKMVIS